MTTATAEVEGPVVVEESSRSKIVRFLGKTPVYLVIVFLGLLWLVPTFGPPAHVAHRPGGDQTAGWWEASPTPSLLTLDNYSEILGNEAITSRSGRHSGSRSAGPSSRS